ncbi:MAG: type IV pilus assembly protein PilM [Planctomycetes bacterium]|nr:type IV pilus assembly protein PilM [Planctomycetota bacterium]
MASPKTAWGIEVGANAIKAIRLERDGDKVSVTDFAIIPLKKVLATPDIDEDEIIRLGLGQFISQKSLEGEHLVMSVPGHSAFARFAKLPPVEPKKVPDIVKFEAVQQIPFPIDEVEWDYQTFLSPNSPEVEVGIFAITRDRMKKSLSLYSELGIVPESITLSPVAVFNAVSYDHNLDLKKEPIVYLDIGTHASDVIIAVGGRCWIRTFPLGGTHFTEAIARTFKLGYTKADRLKQEASSSKYTKQIMQAMRPVFSDLIQDLQRSIGYFQSLNRDCELNTIIGLGSTFKIPGLRKFLGQQLQMNIVRLDEYKKITVGGRDAASFAQNAVGMATAYGLALQGVGLGKIDINLVPVEALRAQMWHEKTKWFAAAAGLAVIASGMMLVKPLSNRSAMSATPPSVVQEVVSTGESLKREYDEIQKTANVGYSAENFRRLADYRDIWPHIVHDAADALAFTDPQAELLGSDIEKINSIDPKERRLVQLQRLDGTYEYDASNNARRILVSLDVELSHENPREFLNTTVIQWLRDNAERPGVPYKIVNIHGNPELHATYRVTEDGSEPVSGSTGKSSRSAPPRREKPKKSNNPPGPKKSGRGGAGSMGMGGGGDMPGRRKRGGKISAPGSQIGSMGQSGGGGALPPPGPGNIGSGGSFDRGSRDNTKGQNAHGELDTIAPLPERPRVYPVGGLYYLVPITFEIELLSSPIVSESDDTANLIAEDGEIGS